ncbi:MAG: MFS transporter, partial [Cyanobacteria bacterium REEB65]|nr:MFS transporter [Cyanobacteria bacterium REEB65]
LLLVYGLNTSTGMVVFNSVLQTRAPDELRGRTFTLFDMTWGTCRLISLVAGGVIADAAGIQALYWAGGSLLVVAGVIGLLGCADGSAR